MSGQPAEVLFDVWKLFRIDQDHAIVRAAVRIGAVGSFRLAGGRSGSGHERERTDALGVVDADD